VFPTPLHQIATAVAYQMIQNEPHAQERVQPIQLLDCWKRVPILPSSPFWNLFWGGWTTLENSSQFLLEKGGAKWHWCFDQPVLLAVRGSQQGEQFRGFPAKRLAILARWHFLWLESRNRDEEWFERDLPHLHPTMVNPIALEGT
jgi:hypothetical protein